MVNLLLTILQYMNLLALAILALKFQTWAFDLLLSAWVVVVAILSSIAVVVVSSDDETLAALVLPAVQTRTNNSRTIKSSPTNKWALNKLPN